MARKDPHASKKRLFGIDEVIIRINLSDGSIFDVVPAFLGEKEYEVYRGLFSSGASEVYLDDMISRDYGSFRKTSERAYPTQGGVSVIEYNYQNETDPRWRGEIRR